MTKKRAKMGKIGPKMTPRLMGHLQKKNKNFQKSWPQQKRRKKSNFFFGPQNGFKMILKWFWSKKKKNFFFGKIFFSFDFRMIFFQKKDPQKEWFLVQKSVFWGLFSQKKSFENRRKKIFSQKKKIFFLLQNHFKMILKPFWGQKKNFDFSRVFW